MMNDEWEKPDASRQFIFIMFRQGGVIQFSRLLAPLLPGALV
jgi:hypothetical protein